MAGLKLFLGDDVEGGSRHADWDYAHEELNAKQGLYSVLSWDFKALVSDFSGFHNFGIVWGSK